MDYWRECVKEAFEDAGLEATEGQVDTVVSWVEGAHDNYGMATGADVVRANFHGERDRRIKSLEKELADELKKVTCKECKGAGWITDHGPHHSASSECFKCRGKGRL